MNETSEADPSSFGGVPACRATGRSVLAVWTCLTLLAFFVLVLCVSLVLNLGGDTDLWVLPVGIAAAVLVVKGLDRAG